MATIRTRKRGKTFSYSFDAGKHPATGRRRIVERGGFSSEQEAYDAGAAAYAAWKAGNIGITSERVPMRDYLAAWVENVARPNVAQGTYGGYVTTIRARIVPYIGGIILQDLRPRDVDRWMSQLAAEGFSRRTIAGARVVLSHALKYAVYPAELIAANPCTGLSVPRSAPAAVIPRVIISPAILAALFQKFPEGHKYHRGMISTLTRGASSFSGKSSMTRQAAATSSPRRKQMRDGARSTLTAYFLPRFANGG